MCTNYRPSARYELRHQFGAQLDDAREYPAETYQDYLAPIIRVDANGLKRADLAGFGMTPKRHIPPGVKPWSSMNCRTETVADKRTFAPAWRNGHLAIVPMQVFYEPCWESGKAVRWRIGMADGAPFGVAALWRTWREIDGSESLAMSLLTLNCDGHDLLGRMHRPPAAGEAPDKRSLIIIPPTEFDAWLHCRDPGLARTFFRLWPADLLHGEPAPLPPRQKAATP